MYPSLSPIFSEQTLNSVWHLISDRPIAFALAFLFVYLCYKVHFFTEIVVDFKDGVPKTVRIHSDGLPPNYPNGWIPIMESAALERSQVKSIISFGQELVAVRGANGQVYVTDAYCPHLGANLAVGGQLVSNCNQDCIRCPFHGWTFRMHDGQCVNVPYENESLPSAKLKVWRSIEINNVIFVWYHADHEEPTWFPQELPEISNKTWRLQGRTEHLVNCHFQEIPENGADVAHLGEIHTNSFFLGSNMQWLPRVGLLGKIVQHEWHAQWSACPPPNAHMSNIEIVNHNKLFGFTLFTVNINVNQIGPAYVELKFKTGFLGGIRGTFLQLVKPVGPMRNSIVHNIYTNNTMAGYLFGKFLIWAEARMLERDIHIWNRKAFLKKPFIAKSEKSLVKFRRWFNQFYSESSVRKIDW